MIKIKKSLLVLIVTLIILSISLLLTKHLIRNNKWLYYRIVTENNYANILEKKWSKLNTRWQVKSEDSIIFNQPSYDDSNWNQQQYLYVELMKNVSKYIWLRNHFIAPSILPKEKLLLRLSLFDIQAQVFLNGVKVADSCFIYNHTVCCNLPSALIKPGQNNLIALRAKNMTVNIANDIKMFKDEVITVMEPTQDLKGIWSFAKGDDMSRINLNPKDTNFKTIQVPKMWESQGFPNYDGFGWYHKIFTRNASFKNQQLMLILGKIDDFHEVYLNGKKIGGHIPKHYVKDGVSDYDVLNCYRIEWLQLEESNILSVRVLDSGRDGGITQGPIGLITMNDFIHFIEN